MPEQQEKQKDFYPHLQERFNVLSENIKKELFHALIEANQDPEDSKAFGKFKLLLCKVTNPKTAQFLKKFGIDADMTDEAGETPLYLATYANNIRAVKVLGAVLVN